MISQQPSIRDRFRYAFDRALSRGPSVVIGWLGLLTFVVILVAAALFAIARLTGVNGEGRLGFGEALWQSMLRVVDAGTFAGDTSWWTRLLGLVVTLVGIFIAGSLIGLIANAVDQRIELLRRGRSMVLESDHTLILGWSARVPSIVSELIIANESRSRSAVVVLAGVDKTVMEETLRDAISEWGTTRLVCRSGDTAGFTDLAMVNATGSRSIIVIGGDDAAVVKTLLAVQSNATPGSEVPIVAEVVDEDVAASIRALFTGTLAIVNSDAVVAELTAQACRQRGLSWIFHELLDFDGDEIYFESFPSLAGRSYIEAQLAFETSSLMGIMTSNGELTLNPPPTTVLAEDDQLIGIASDDSTFICGEIQVPKNWTFLASSAGDDERADRRVVLVGWSILGPRVISELDDFLGIETTVEIVVDPDIVDVDEIRRTLTSHNIKIEVVADGGRPEQVAGHVAHRAIDEVIVLGRRDGISEEEADAHTLLMLLAFNNLAKSEGLTGVRVVAEMLQQKHAQLARATGTDDFIVSDELTSLMVAQLSESHELDRVFRDLFDYGSCTVELVPAARYGAAAAASFAEIVLAASALGDSALGYQRPSTGEIVLNPPKSAPIGSPTATPSSFSPLEAAAKRQSDERSAVIRMGAATSPEPIDSDEAARNSGVQGPEHSVCRALSEYRLSYPAGSEHDVHFAER